MWRFVNQLTVDATKNGNVARWIDQSCEPNIQCGSRTP
jgi:SET domain-containing protein